jgi:hypothetical protein
MLINKKLFVEILKIFSEISERNTGNLPGKIVNYDIKKKAI